MVRTVVNLAPPDARGGSCFRAARTFGKAGDAIELVLTTYDGGVNAFGLVEIHVADARNRIGEAESKAIHLHEMGRRVDQQGMDGLRATLIE